MDLHNGPEKLEFQAHSVGKVTKHQKFQQHALGRVELSFEHQCTFALTPRGHPLKAKELNN